MKIKGNSGISLKTVSAVSAVMFGLLFVLRLYHIFFLTDGTTGFFTKHDITTAAMYVLFVGSVIAVCVLCYICGNMPAGEVKKKTSLLYTVAGFLFSFSLLYDGIKGLRKVLSAGSGNWDMMKEAAGGNIGLFSSIFAFLGAAVILISVILYLKNGALTGKLRLPMLFPVIWAFLRTLGFFSVTVSYVKVSQLLLTIFAAAFLMVFLFENARVTADVGRKQALWFFYATGIIAAGLSLCSSVPALLASIFAPEKLVSYCPFELYALAGGLYALASLTVRDAISCDTAEITESVTETE